MHAHYDFALMYVNIRNFLARYSNLYFKWRSLYIFIVVWHLI